MIVTETGAEVLAYPKYSRYHTDQKHNVANTTGGTVYCVKVSLKRQNIQRLPDIHRSCQVSFDEDIFRPLVQLGLVGLLVGASDVFIDQSL